MIKRQLVIRFVTDVTQKRVILKRYVIIIIIYIMKTYTYIQTYLIICYICYTLCNKLVSSSLKCNRFQNNLLQICYICYNADNQ